MVMLLYSSREHYHIPLILVRYTQPSEIGARRQIIQKKEPFIKTTESRPRQYYYIANNYPAERDVAKDNSVAGPETLKESDLYPPLIEFLDTEHKTHSKIINHLKSRKSAESGKNRWLFPDVVGLENLSSNWSMKVIDFATSHGYKKAKLWSFEVKCKIDSGNLRESFFQTLSNSSWANLSYLVAGDFEEGAMKELRILSNLHGVGFILLDKSNPTESQIVIPARERESIDWNSLNRLAETSEDFSKYVEGITDHYSRKKNKKPDWD